MTLTPLHRSVLTLLTALAAVALLSGCASTGGSRSANDEVVAKLMAHYRQWQGTPYRHGGATRRGVDCSAFVQTAYRSVFRVDLPRYTKDQARVGRRVSRKRLESGDLVFFKTGWFTYHVGVYVGDSRFIHASESRGVITSSLNSAYWSHRFWKARRIV